MPTELINRVYCDGCGKEIDWESTFYPVILRDDTTDNTTYYFHNYEHVKTWADQMSIEHSAKITKAEENKVIQEAAAQQMLKEEI